jgi:hypothetical protein
VSDDVESLALMIEVGPRRQQFKRRLSLAEELAMAGDESDTDEYSDDDDGNFVDETPVRSLSQPEPSSSSSSSSDSEEGEEEDSEDDSHEEVPGESESPVGDLDSDSEDTSVDGEDESEDERAPRPAPAPTLADVVGRTARDVKGRKQLESRVEVISPPTSPERVPGAIAGVS